MNKRQRMCEPCPWNPDRSGPPIPDAVMRDAQRRIDGGEAWVCHSTCDGAQVTPRSSLCAGARSTLTRTQKAALAELNRHGHMWPSSPSPFWNPQGTGHAPYSRRTLQALVDADLAIWVNRHDVMPFIERKR